MYHVFATPTETLLLLATAKAKSVKRCLTIIELVVSRTFVALVKV